MMDWFPSNAGGPRNPRTSGIYFLSPSRPLRAHRPVLIPSACASKRGLHQAPESRQESDRIEVGCLCGLTLYFNIVTFHFYRYYYFCNMNSEIIWTRNLILSFLLELCYLFWPRALLLSSGPSGTDSPQSETWRGSHIVLCANQTCFEVLSWSRVLGACLYLKMPDASPLTSILRKQETRYWTTHSVSLS